MKICVIGDIHGRQVWKQIVNQNLDSDYIVFIGDYFDSFDINGNDQVNNFLEIIEFKKQYNDKVILLIGNHDFHYMSGCYSVYTGYQAGASPLIIDTLKQNNHLLQVVFNVDNYLFSHAGISNTWYETNVINNDKLARFGIDKNVDAINLLFEYTPSIFNFISNDSDQYKQGDSIDNGPLWIRPKSLRSDRLNCYTHIVGHTHTENIVIGDDVCLIDTLPREYLIIDNGQFKIEKIAN